MLPQPACHRVLILLPLVQLVNDSKVFRGEREVPHLGDIKRRTGLAGEKKTIQPAGFVFDALLYRTWAIRRHLVLSPIVITPADHLTGLFTERNLLEKRNIQHTWPGVTLCLSAIDLMVESSSRGSRPAPRLA